VIVLFLALFPNFVDTDRGNETAQLLTLSATLIVINTLWQAPIALAADVVRRWLSSDAVRRRVTVSSSLIFIGFAIGILMQHLV
jgi:threonine/homoserine/homoserine lactone efflux protein